MTDETVAISPAQASSSMAMGVASIDWADNEECPVCRKVLGSREVGVPNCCSHFFCYTCIKSWVTKSKSNCPMDRLDITELKVFDSRGKFLKTEKVEPREQEDEVDFIFDEDGICPDCGWMGMRATVGVCLHCMYHVENPFPVRNCPQCMEDESNASDGEWVPDTNGDAADLARRRSLRSDNNQHVLLDDDWTSHPDIRQRVALNRRRRARNLEQFIIDDGGDESDHSVDLQALAEEAGSDKEDTSEDSVSDLDAEEEAEIDYAQPGPSTSRGPPRAVRKAPVRKTTTKRKRKTTTKKKKTRKRKVTRRKTAAGTKGRRKTKRRKTTRRKKKTVSKRPSLPEDSAKRRLARVLGVKAPKFSGQMLPRGCKKRPVTAAQRQAMASTSSSTVYNRPLESLDYHNNAVPTLHLFGGAELDYFPSGTDSDASSSSSYMAPKRPLPSTSASVIKRYKNNALKSLRKRAVTAASVEAPPPVNLLDSILESQGKKFEIKSGIENRLDPYKATPPPSTLSENKRKLRFSVSDEASSSSAAGASRATNLATRKLSFSAGETGEKKIFKCKKSPSREDDLDLYGDIPAEGSGNNGEDEDGGGDEDDYLFDGGDGGGSNNGGDENDNNGEDDKKEPDEVKEEEEEKDDEDEEDETEDISEMVIDETVLAPDLEAKEIEEETKDPLEIPESEVEPPITASPEPDETSEKVIVPDFIPENAYPVVLPIVDQSSIVAPPVLAPPVFRYSETSLQIARHLNFDDEVPPRANEEPEDYPEEPESEPENPPDNCDESGEENLARQSPQVPPVISALPESAKSEEVSPSRSLSPAVNNKTDVEKSPLLEPPKLTNGIDSDGAGAKKASRSKSRKQSLVEELFGSDIEESVPARKISTDKGSEDGEIKDKKRKSLDEEASHQTKKENEAEPEIRSVRSSPKRGKKKKEKSKDGGNKKKKKDRKRSRSRSRSRSSSPDRKRKHHSRKYSPARHSRKRSRSRSRSRKRHEENGRLPVHERLGPKRGRSRDRSEDRPSKKEVYSSGENILVSVNFSRRRKRIAEIAAKRRPVAVINLAVDEDKSPIVEKGDSPKEVIDLDEGWSTDEEPKKSKQKETPSKQKEKSAKSKETGPKTPPEPQVKFSIASRPQLKHKNVLGAHDDDDEPEPEPKETNKPPAGETYDPFNPTASPNQEAENEPPAAVSVQVQTKISSVPPEGAPQQRPLSPPKLMTEMPKIERPPAAVPVVPLVKPTVELFPGLPANVANILCSSQLQNVFNPQLSALAVPLLLSAPCFMNMQNVVQHASQPSTAAASSQSKPDNGVVDMELESPYSPAASEGDDLFEPPAGKGQNQTGSKSQEKFDNLFGSTNKRATKSTTKAAPSSSKTPVKEIKTSVVTPAGKKDISIKMDRNNLKVVGDLPNPAVETQVKEKFLKKLNRQERVVEEVKVALKPHYTKKLINKEEYKDILRRAVPKVCHNKSGEINPVKIKSLVSEYVKRVRHERKKSKKA